MKTELSTKEKIIKETKLTGVLPCIKVKREVDYVAYAKAMYNGGARIVEVTMTSPGALKAIENIASKLEGKIWVAAGTVLDSNTAKAVVDHGGSLIVSPTVNPKVIDTAISNGVPVYSGAFTASECKLALDNGASMVKIFPAHLGGPAYMTNLKMVLPSIDLIPSGGINEKTASEYIRSGACAVSGARTFLNEKAIKKEGLDWISRKVAIFISLVKEAKNNRDELP